MSRAFGSFHPQAMPRLARGHYRRELLAWLFLPIMMGAVEGGVVGVIAKNAFDGVVPEAWLRFAVAVLSGAPAFANVTSILWASLSHGRDKIRFLVALQVSAALLVALVATAPHNGAGLIVLTIGAVGARVCWSGVVTIRATIWRANYQRSVRACLAGKLATVQALMLATIGFFIGLAMRAEEQSFHLLYPLAAACGLIGAMIYGRMRMRGHAAVLGAERREDRHGSRIGESWRILRGDAKFRAYMLWMFVLGIGNIMIAAPLVIVLRDEFGYGYLGGILVISTIPIVMMPPSIPLWSRLLDRAHIVRFRAIHCWAFVATTAALFVGVVWHIAPLIWVSAVVKGIAIGGGVLAWNLGHIDFAPPERTSQYMGVHVTLTGIRGIVGPIIAVGLYDLFDRWHPGSGGWVFGVCLALNLMGAAGFVALRRRFDAANERPASVRDAVVAPVAALPPR